MNIKTTKRAIVLAAIATAIGAVTACNGPTTPPTQTPANIVGSYNLTVTASPTCSANLPADAREFKSIADIAQTAGNFTATLLGHVVFVSVAVNGSVTGQTVTFSTFALNELSMGVVMSTTGTANVAADGSMTGTLNGTYQATATGVTCTAANHQIKLVKR
jgi:hypothetical protein